MKKLILISILALNLCVNAKASQAVVYVTALDDSSKGVTGTINSWLKANPDKKLISFSVDMRPTTVSSRQVVFVYKGIWIVYDDGKSDGSQSKKG